MTARKISDLNEKDLRAIVADVVHNCVRTELQRHEISKNQIKDVRDLKFCECCDEVPKPRGAAE